MFQGKAISSSPWFKHDYKYANMLILLHLQANEHSFQVSIDDVCAAVNTTVKLKFEPSKNIQIRINFVRCFNIPNIISYLVKSEMNLMGLQTVQVIRVRFNVCQQITNLSIL